MQHRDLRLTYYDTPLPLLASYQRAENTNRYTKVSLYLYLILKSILSNANNDIPDYYRCAVIMYKIIKLHFTIL